MLVRAALVVSVVLAACEARTGGGVAAVEKGRSSAAEAPVGATARRAGGTSGASASAAAGGGAREVSADRQEASSMRRDAGGESRGDGGGESRGDGGGESRGDGGSESRGASGGAGASGEAKVGGIRLVLVADHALLGSEVKGLGRLESELGMGGEVVTRVEAAGEERAAAEGALGAAPMTSLPMSWSTATRVVVVRVAAPRAMRSGARISRGVTDVALLRPPWAEPELRMRVEEAVAVRADESWSRWVAELARGGEG